jgi:3-methyladenine DNA glycosylase/8-oxoguanine DNA glycosylase
MSPLSRRGGRGVRRRREAAPRVYVSVVPARLELPLRGPRGEPVDFRRLLASHGVAALPPTRIDEDAWTLETTVRIPRGRPRTIRVHEPRRGIVAVEVFGPAADGVVGSVRRILNLDEDLSEFYAAASNDPELVWATGGAGRMLRSETVFQTVVTTICTTNCAWSATVRMVTALVDHLGEPSAADKGHAFPKPEAMASADEAFYRDVVRAGYRGPYLRSLAGSVADGSVDLEALDAVVTDELPDDEVEERLLALPGVGPYAAAHIMMLLGRHSRLILDSWTRPKFARVAGRKASDAAIKRRFRRYGRFAGLAFWLFLTRDWVEEETVSAGDDRSKG